MSELFVLHSTESAYSRCLACLYNDLSYP